MKTTTDHKISELVDHAHEISNTNGFWNDLSFDSGVNVIGTKLALVHSEVSEALEVLRSDPSPSSLSQSIEWRTELADIVLRVMDLAGATMDSRDFHAALVNKMNHNREREFKCSV